MKHIPITLTEQPELTLYGLHMPSNDRTQHKDIPALTAKLREQIGDHLPLYILSKDYDPLTHRFTLFIGSDRQSPMLETEILPGSIYARMPICPKFRFLWGMTVGKAKRFFYTEWLPQNAYTALNLEYELHTEKTCGKHPEADLLFALQKCEKVSE